MLKLRQVCHLPDHWSQSVARHHPVPKVSTNTPQAPVYQKSSPKSYIPGSQRKLSSHHINSSGLLYIHPILGISRPCITMYSHSIWIQESEHHHLHCTPASSSFSNFHAQKHPTRSDCHENERIDHTKRSAELTPSSPTAPMSVCCTETE